jgi:hypothetical protein
LIVSSKSVDAGSREGVDAEATALGGCCISAGKRVSVGVISELSIMVGSSVKSFSTQAVSFILLAPESLRCLSVEEVLDRPWLVVEALDKRLLIGSSMDALSTGLTVDPSAPASPTTCPVTRSKVTGSRTAAGVLDETAIGMREGLLGRGKLLEGSGMLILRSSFGFFEERVELPEKVCNMLVGTDSNVPSRPNEVGVVGCLPCAGTALRRAASKTVDATDREGRY